MPLLLLLTVCRQEAATCGEWGGGEGEATTRVRDNYNSATTTTTAATERASVRSKQDPPSTNVV